MADKIVKKALHAPNFLNEPIEYGNSFSRGVHVDFGGVSMVFISGTASIDERGRTFKPNDFMAQTKRTFDNITGLLMSKKNSWYDVVKTTCYLKDMKYYGQFNEYRSDFYKKQKLKPFPASVCIEANLCRPDLLVEIDAIAVIRKKPEA